ncbi:hypothetical protein [Rhodoglobus aureus]|uniref:hypothetical protein n=1 Tax=Rhodoglobus aureus TaxID=191497 RepID=UPI0031D3434C
MTIRASVHPCISFDMVVIHRYGEAQDVVLVLTESAGRQRRLVVDLADLHGFVDLHDQVGKFHRPFLSGGLSHPGQLSRVETQL